MTGQEVFDKISLIYRNWRQSKQGWPEKNEEIMANIKALTFLGVRNLYALLFEKMAECQSEFTMAPHPFRTCYGMASHALEEKFWEKVDQILGQDGYGPDFEQKADEIEEIVKTLEIRELIPISQHQLEEDDHFGHFVRGLVFFHWAVFTKKEEEAAKS